MDDLPEYVCNEVFVFEPIIHEPLEGILVSPQASPSSTPTDDSFYCTACKKKFSTKQTFQTHEKTTKHINNLKKMRQSLSPSNIESKKVSTVINEKELEQLNKQVLGYENIIQNKPNQGIKGIFLAAQALIKRNYLRSGAIALHKLLYYIEKTIPNINDQKNEPLYKVLPIGRLIIYLKSSMIISRLFQITYSPSSHKKSKEYATRAISCFFNIKKLQKAEKNNKLPYDMIISQLTHHYDVICKEIPHNFQSKSENCDDSPHDVYFVIYSLLIEISGLFSLFKVSRKSLCFYLLACSISKFENQNVDYLNALQHVVLIKDYFSFMDDYLKFFLIKKSNETSCTFYNFNIDVLQSMNNHIAYFERLELFEKTKLSCWLIEVFIISLVQFDTIMLSYLEEKKTFFDNLILSDDKNFPFLQIFWDLAHIVLCEDFLSLVDFQNIFLYKKLAKLFPLLPSIYNILLDCLTD